MDALGTHGQRIRGDPDGGHFLQFENVNMQFYDAVQQFLEAEK